MRKIFVRKQRGLSEANPLFESLQATRDLADQAFSRAAGAPLIDGNAVSLLKNAEQNYPAWLDAIQKATNRICFECYIIRDDEAGHLFADALIRKAKEGVTVRLIYDWMGGFGKTSQRFWNQLIDGGIHVRCYNPPSLLSPFGWVSRDHRKMLSVDGEVGFITGLCVGNAWVGNAEKGIEPWRDTGIEVRGPAVVHIERAFEQVWGMIGAPVSPSEISPTASTRPGNISMRVIASLPATAGMLRLDQLVAALARKRLWLTDAYFAGTPTYVEALKAAAKDNVDVRLLLPNASDVAILKPISRSGYRSLLEGGVRIFEWNGTMLHAKTALADDRWARVGSTNLNVASWFGNCELDAVVEDQSFAAEMEKMYLEDLQHATEVVLDSKSKVRAPRRPAHTVGLSSGRGSTGRAAAGVMRIGSTVGAAFTNRRKLEPVEANIMLTTGLVLLLFACIFIFYPRALGYPLAAILLWISIVLFVRAIKLRMQRSRKSKDLQGQKSSVSQH